MRKNFVWVFSAAIIVMAVLVSYIMDTGDGAAYSISSTGERGASLLFDTLRHMDYRVRASYRPLTSRTGTDYVYIIIQPRTPLINYYMAEEMIEWVRNGGRLIFLRGNHPLDLVFDNVINTAGIDLGDFWAYRVGSGEIITGSAPDVRNDYLMNNSGAGQAIQLTLDRWNSERDIATIFFAEYYHGFHTAETFVGRLPLVMRLLLAQVLILTIIAIWHFGKRFGNPVPYYEETEREENEYVHALARLYMENNKKGEKE
ncbi:MAG: DUF4350 domain-containing protein [Defluviitaleaceae bacterium]|nr:DUF4350 domain-containing protein [Defluviitaleaceae bacterium]